MFWWFIFELESSEIAKFNGYKQERNGEKFLETSFGFWVYVKFRRDPAMTKLAQVFSEASLAPS